jgi:Transcriptional regulators
MTFGEYSALWLIDQVMEKEEEPITPTELNDYFGTKKPATSRILTVLEKKGFIEKYPEEKDHRLTHLKLTEAGREALREEEAGYRKLTEKIMRRMGNENLEKLRFLLEKLENVLKEEIQDMKEKE